MATMATSKMCGCVRQGRILNYFRFKEVSFTCKNNISGIRSYSTRKFTNFSNVRQSSAMAIGAGIGVGALLGAGYSYHKIREARSGVLPVMNQGNGTESKVLPSRPNVQPSRQIVIPTDNTGLKLTLFQYTTCPFCCKVRAFLDYYGFSYDVVEVNPVLRHEVKWSEYKKVPILLAQVEDGYQQLNDSSMIVSALMSYMLDRDQGLKEVVKCFPSISFSDDDGKVKSEIMNRYFLMYQSEDLPPGRTKENILQERKWRKWVDDTLVHVLSPNVYRTRAEALQAFNWFSEVGEWEKHFSAWERHLVVYVGAAAMWLIGKRLKRRHGLKDDVRQSLYDECNHWARAVGRQDGRFMGGATPDLSDLAVFGVLNSIEGCEAFADLMEHSRIGRWYDDVKAAVANHEGSHVMSK